MAVAAVGIGLLLGLSARLHATQPLHASEPLQGRAPATSRARLDAKLGEIETLVQLLSDDVSARLERIERSLASSQLGTVAGGT